MIVQKIWYTLVRAYIKLGLQFYFQEIQVQGFENIPKKGAVLFCPNHQNAFMDALLVTTHCGRSGHYLVRADIFKKRLANWLLTSLNMMPIFRIRDGRTAMAGNDAIFERCANLLLQHETILLFPEGNHNIQRRLRPLSKGFTRLLFAAMEKDKELDVKIVPVGINFTAHQAFRSKVSLWYGEPISSIEFFKKDASLELRDILAVEMRKLITHIDTENYDDTLTKLEATNPNYLNPIETTSRLKDLDPLGIATKKEVEATGLIGKVLSAPFYLINFIPLMIWRSIGSDIKDPAFLASIKFCVGIFIFPLYYLGLIFLASLLISDLLIIVALSILLIATMPLLNYLKAM